MKRCRAHASHRAKLSFEWTHPAVGRMIRPARARIGASALQHEPFHEAMKYRVVVPTCDAEHQETLDGIKKRIVASQWFRSVHGTLNTIPGYEAMHMLR